MPSYTDMAGIQIDAMKCSDCSALVPRADTYQHDLLHSDLSATRFMAMNGDTAFRHVQDLKDELAELRNQTPDPPLPAPDARPVLVDLTLLDGDRHIRLGAIRWKGTTLAEVGMLLQPPNSDKVYKLVSVSPEDFYRWYVERVVGKDDPNSWSLGDKVRYVNNGKVFELMALTQAGWEMKLISGGTTIYTESLSALGNPELYEWIGQ